MSVLYTYVCESNCLIFTVRESEGGYEDSVEVAADVLSVELGGLEPFTEYSVVVVAETEGGGVGESSDPAIVITAEAGQLCIIIILTCIII